MGLRMTTVQKKTLRVMVADDNRDIVESMGMMLKDWGYDVIEAKNGDEAIEKAAAEKPDVILLDLAMPGVTGLDVAKALYKGRENDKRPILIAHTAHNRPLHQQLTMEAGFDLLLVKPVAPEHLRQVLDRFE